MLLGLHQSPTPRATVLYVPTQIRSMGSSNQTATSATLPTSVTSSSNNQFSRPSIRHLNRLPSNLKPSPTSPVKIPLVTFQRLTSSVRCHENQKVCSLLALTTRRIPCDHQRRLSWPVTRSKGSAYFDCRSLYLFEAYERGVPACGNKVATRLPHSQHGYRSVRIHSRY